MAKKKEAEAVGYTVTVPVHFPSHRELIKWMRERAGLTQGQLARKLKTKQPAIARLERQKAHPSLTTLHKVATACGFSMGAPAFACKKCGLDIRECACKKPKRTRS